MLKDFLYELFGIQFHGLTFERLLWTAIVIGGSIMLYRGYNEKREAGASPWDGNAIFGGVVVLAAAWFAVQAWTNASYQLFFTEPLVLHTYGVAIATGFVVAIWLAVIEARRTGLDPVAVMDISFWALVAGLAGSRIAFMMVEWESYYNMCFNPAAEGLTAPDCFAVLRFWQGGLVFYGGLIGAIIVIMIFMNQNGLNKARYADALAPAVPMGQFFGRLGCLAAGCCHGKYCPPDMMAALQWPSGTTAHRVIMPNGLPEGAPRELFEAGGYVTAHPTQLYESGFMLLSVILLLWLRTKKKFHGQVVLTYVMLYAIARSFIELFRGDKIRGFIFEFKNAAISQFLGLPTDEPLLLSTSQMISVVMFVTAAVLWVYLSRKQKKKEDAIRDLKAAA